MRLIDSATSAGAIYAKNRMDISGGNVVIEESESKGLRGNGGRRE